MMAARTLPSLERRKLMNAMIATVMRHGNKVDEREGATGDEAQCQTHVLNQHIMIILVQLRTVQGLTTIKVDVEGHRAQ